MKGSSINFNKNLLKEIKSIHLRLRDEIKLRLDRFKAVGDQGDDLEIFSELAFCLLTPQSKAKVCWPVIVELVEKNILLTGTEAQFNDELRCVRFRYTKAKNLISAKKLFSDNGEVVIKSKLEEFTSPVETREWLVKYVRGMNYKEASHFLRNIGLGTNLAILDRHILKNLETLRVIDEIPKSLSRKRYLEIEEKMMAFSDRVKIPMDHLDLLLWYKETGEIYK